MSLWQRIKAWWVQPDPQEARVTQGTQPIPRDLHVPGETTHGRMLDEVPDTIPVDHKL